MGWLRSLIVTLLLALASVVACTNSSGPSTVAGCTDFSGQPAPPGSCNGGFFVVLQDADDPMLEEFWVTIRRVELLSERGTFLFFEGERTEDLLRYSRQGFLLGFRDDVAEVVYDGVRLHFDGPDVLVSNSITSGLERARGVELLGAGVVDVWFDQPVEVGPEWRQGLHLDFDVRASVKSLTEGRCVVDPVVEARVLGAEPADLAELRAKVVAHPTGDPYLMVDVVDSRSSLRADLSEAVLVDESGAPMSLDALRIGDAVQLQGAIDGDGTLLVGLLRRAD